MLARLLNSKGVRIYFEAAKNIKALYPDIIFYLAGNVDDLNNDSISKVELDSWVKSGVIDYYGSLKDVRSAIVNCSVYVLPSFYREGTPRSILEAMSTGRAIITTDTPGCRETVVNGKNGYLIAPKSAPDLVNSMLKFVKNPNIISDMGIKSREIAEEKYDVKKVNLKMLRTMKIVK
jgi:glycosyltransferase involved in cell wall biosynthesis